MSRSGGMTLRSPAGTLRVSSVFAGALLLWSVVMLISVTFYPHRTDFKRAPVLAVELPHSDAALEQALGENLTATPELTKEIHHVLEWNTLLDFVFIFCYTTFLVSFTYAIFPDSRIRWFRPVCALILAAAVFDCVENYQILKVIYGSHPVADAIRTPSEVKWILLGIIFLVDGILVAQSAIFGKSIGRILGVLLALSGLSILLGLMADSDSVLQNGSLLFTLAPIITIFRRVVEPRAAVDRSITKGSDALAQELQHLYGKLVIGDWNVFRKWVMSDSALAQKIREVSGDPPALELSASDRDRIEAYLNRLANGSGSPENAPKPEVAENATNPDLPASKFKVQAVSARKTLRRCFDMEPNGDSKSSDSSSVSNHRNTIDLLGQIPGLRFQDSFSDGNIEHAALCLSGGGVRSATFNLGILQGLNRSGLLDKFAYLSTVSGGGFIGGWLSALKLRKPWSKLPDDNLAPAIGHLRGYSNYLTPDVGLLSIDTWSLITIYLRNLILTWIVIVPCIAAALMAPRLLLSLYTRTPGDFAVSILFLATGFTALTLSIGYMGAHLPSHDLDRESLLLLRRRSSFVPVVVLAIFDAYVISQIGWSSPWMMVGGVMQLAIVAPMFLDSANPDTGTGTNPSIRDGQIEFIYRALLPLLISALCLTSCWKWLPRSTPLRYAPFFVVGSAVAVLVPWAVCSMWARHEQHRKLSSDKNKIDIDRLNDFDFKLAFSFLLLSLGAALGGALGWFIATRNWFPYTDAMYVSFAAPILLGIYLITGTLMAGAISRHTRDDDEEWWARAGAWTLTAGMAWMVFTVGVLILPPISVEFLKGLYVKWFTSSMSWGDIAKAAAALMGGLSAVASLIAGFSGKTPGSKESGAEVSPALSMLAPVGATVGLVYIMVLIAWGSEKYISILASRLSWAPGSPLLLLLVLASFILFGFLAGLAINTNKFSLHYYWRNRIVRAYLGASNSDTSKLNSFIGFTTNDNVQMCELREIANRRPLHVLNLALNLTSSHNLALQERKAESFTISPLHCGCSNLGYRDSRHYGRGRFSGKEGISLGTAMALSGAAVSPNMGYMVSSPVLRFLMTLFNLRLGAWFGNPSQAGNRTFQMESPAHSVGPIVREALGLVNEDSPWVYLSDGGHFENLGLYEMARRRCQFILVADASTDSNYEFESLAVSVRKIRIDFNFSVSIQRAAPIGRFTDGKGSYYALGKIHYSPGNEGKLIYIKASMMGEEPEDIQNYQRANKSFPQESIADQFFTESQFESYRGLGEHIMSTMIKKAKGASDLATLYDALSEATSSVSEDPQKSLITVLKKVVASA